MLTNLLRPWILARLLTGVSAAVLVLLSLVVAARVLKHFRVSALSEGQLALERRAELVATVVQAALFMSLVGLVLTVLGADRMAGSIRGAMCAYGVLASTGWGFAALAVSAVAAAACALWIVLHRLDLRLQTPALTRRKFGALFLVAPLVLLDLFTTTAHALSLDLTVVASCCSAGLDSVRPEVAAGTQGPGGLAFGVALVAGAGAVASGVWARRRPGAAAGASAAVLSLVALAASIPAILWYVAPHAYETPFHTCPFCLLHADVGGIGWPLFLALFGGAVLGLSLGLVQTQRRASGDEEAVADVSRSLGRWTAVAWAAVVVLLLFPVVRFAVATGGADLFGV